MATATSHCKSCCLRLPVHRRANEKLNTLQADESGDTSEKQSQSDLNLITSRLRELEAEHAEPERREALKRRKKQLKEMTAIVDDKQKSAEDKIAFLVQRFQQQVCTFPQI